MALTLLQLFCAQCIFLTWSIRPPADLQIFLYPANWQWKSSFLVVGSCCCCCSTKGFCLECTYLGNKLMGWPLLFHGPRTLVQLRLQGIDFAVLLIAFTPVFEVIGVIVIIFIVTFLVAIVVTVELIARQIPIKRGRKMNLWLLIF